MTSYLFSGDNHKCMKCGKTAVTVARIKDHFCGDCFGAYFVQRFRTTLGKSRLVNYGEKVLLAFSGGPSSRVLLQLVEHSLTGKRLKIFPGVLYIDEGGILQKNLVERCQATTSILSIAEESKFPTFFVQLEQVFSSTAKVHNFCSSSSDLKSCEDTVLSQSDEALLTRLVAALENVTSLSAKENLLVTFRHRLLTEVAQRYGYTKVFVGDNANRVSTRLLGNIAQGRASTIPLDTGLVDDRNRDVHFIRPLRELPIEEIMEFLLLNNLKTIITPTVRSTSNSVSSIESITETFINGLQAHFPATINTIFRTGEKLSGCKEDALCDLCKAPFRQLADDGVFCHLPQEIGLCYGCRLTVKNMKGAVTGCLPFCEITKKQ